MSTAKVLTKKQQKSTLSAKKTRNKETLRNVLASPFIKFWPKIDEESAKILRESLSTHLPLLIEPAPKILWKELKNLPKNERPTRHKKKPPEVREGLIFGVNDVARALEKRQVTSVLITEDVLPRLMVEHIIDHSVLNQTPCLVVPGLRTMLKSVCGLCSIAVAFVGNSKYRPVEELIAKIAENHPVPEKHINFKRALPAPTSVIVLEDSIMVVEPEEVVKNAHLKRTSKERVFLPKEPLKVVCAVNRKLPDVTLKKSYTSLKVKKVKRNVTRTKRKLEEMKKPSKKVRYLV